METSIAKDGYLILRSVFTEEQLQPIRELADEIIGHAELGLEDVFEDPYMKHRSDQGALYDLYQRHPEFHPFAQNKRILDAVSDYLGDDIVLYVNSMIYKPEGRNNEVPWHQDFLSRPDETDKLIVWMAMDDAKIENGCLKVIPGTHTTGGFPWYRVKGETHHDRIKLDGVDLTKAQYCELNAGDVLIFHQHVLHGSDKVDTPTARRGYRVAYQAISRNKVPRGGAIVVRGGRPNSLKNKFTKKAEVTPAVKDFLHKVGKRLIDM